MMKDVSMITPWEDLPGDPASGLLLIADHASNRVPDGISLGVAPEIMDEHVAIDIGVAPLGRALCAGLGMMGILGNVSRLVIDLNREPDAAGLIPEVSDGHVLPGNRSLDEAGRQRRLHDFWAPYHARVAELIAASGPTLLVSLHSFTPSLREGASARRPWEVGVLYNQDDRAARIAIPLLQAAGVITGDNEPYSGKVLNATMNRHGEENGLAYLGLEVRQDLIGDESGVARWCARLAPIITKTVKAL
jgi:predicted N-formylglutamate amidohydrolase